MNGVSLHGFAELERDLLALPDKVAKSIGRKAARRAIKPMADAAKAHAPVRTGRLRKSLRVKVDLLRGETALGRVISAMLYVSGSQGYRPRKTDRRSRVKGKLQDAAYPYQIGSRPDVYGKFVEFGIPGHGPRPFLRPAFDSNAQRAVQIMGEELGDGIAAAMKA